MQVCTGIRSSVNPPKFHRCIPGVSILMSYHERMMFEAHDTRGFPLSEKPDPLCTDLLL